MDPLAKLLVKPELRNASNGSTLFALRGDFNGEFYIISAPEKIQQIKFYLVTFKVISLIALFVTVDFLMSIHPVSLLLLYSLIAVIVFPMFFGTVYHVLMKIITKELTPQHSLKFKRPPKTRGLLEKSRK